MAVEQRVVWQPQPGPQRLALECTVPDLFFGGARGGGKRLAHDTPVPVPLSTSSTGWKMHGDLQPGDRVYHPSGREVVVLAVAPEAVPARCFAVEFDTGDEIVADAEHLWRTWTRAEWPLGDGMVRTTQHIADNLDGQHGIPACLRLDGDDDVAREHRAAADACAPASRWRFIAACRPVPPVPMRCIQVDAADGLYLAGRAFITTHNSEALLGKAVQHAERWGKGARGLIVRQQFPQLRELIDRMREIVEPIGVVYRATDHRFTWPSGAVVFMGALEREKDAEKWQGANLTFFGVDEAGNFDTPNGLNRVFAAMRSARGQRAQRFMTGNPGGPGHQWLKERYVDVTGPMRVFRPSVGQPRVFIPSYLGDNRLLTENDPTYVDRLYDSGPSWLVEAWLRGDWNATLVGKLIKLAHLQRYDETPGDETFVRRIISLDAAVKDKEWESRNVAQHWGQQDGGRKYLLDEWADHATYPELRDKVREMAERLRPNALVIEDKGNGSALIQEFRADPKFTIPIEAIDPVANKVLRMDAETAQIDEGMVYVPRWAPWLPPWETEVSLFPQGRWKDRVDAMSLALWFLRSRDIAAWSFDFMADRKLGEEEKAMPTWMRRPMSGFRRGG